MKSGFTIVELIIVIGILAVVFGYGAIASVNYYKNSLLDAELDKLVSLLSLARAQALNNVNESDHGLYVGTNQYTVYQGSSYVNRSSSLDEVFPREASIGVSGQTDVAFHSPDGSSSSTGTILFSSGSRTLSVSVNGEGMIDY